MAEAEVVADRQVAPRQRRGDIHAEEPHRRPDPETGSCCPLQRRQREIPGPREDLTGVDEAHTPEKLRQREARLLVQDQRGLPRDRVAEEVEARQAVVGSAVYRATKAALEAMTLQFAAELGPKGVRVNAVAPGFIQTPILDTMPEKVIAEMAERVPLRRLGQAAEIANTYAFLASDEASYINGAVIEVSGGMTV